jgi:hypothetical protein
MGDGKLPLKEVSMEKQLYASSMKELMGVHSPYPELTAILTATWANLHEHI